MNNHATHPLFQAAVDRIYREIGEDGRRELGSLERGNLIMCHFGLAMGVRNSLGLWHDHLLVEACGEQEADGASMRIVEGVWEKIQAEDAGNPDTDVS